MGVADLPACPARPLVVLGCAPWGLDGQVVAGGGGPVATACRACQFLAQGQWVGRCRSSRRLVEAIRAATRMILRRRLLQRALGRAAAVAAARARLKAITAQETQAALATYLPEGRWASALSGLPEIFRTRLLGFFRLLLVIPGEMRGPRWESCTPDPSGACVDYRTIRSTGQ